MTWYRSPPDPRANEYCGRTVYNEWDILSMMTGFSCQFSYGGHTAEFFVQWGLFLTRCDS